MTICSYVIYVENGYLGEVLEQLSAVPGCTAEPVPHRDMLMLITETDDEADEAFIRQKLGDFPHVEAVFVAFGNTPAIKETA